MYKQTLCFIQRNDELLMLNREYKTTQGLWNGVGGKIEENETPLECVIREVKEETNIDISGYQIIDKGVITWEVVNSLYTGGIVQQKLSLSLGFKVLPWVTKLFRE